MIGLLLVLILVARSLVPAVGVFFLGWEPERVLLLFFLDTMLGLGTAILALALSASKPAPGAGGSSFSRMASALKILVGTLILLVFLAIPLGGALVFILAGSDFSIVLTLHDWSFQRSLELQALASLAGGALLFWKLRTRTPDEAGIKPLFGLILLRWLILVAVTYTGIPAMMGRGGPYFLVLVYCAAMIFSEIDPGRFARLLPSGRAPSRVAERE